MIKIVINVSKTNDFKIIMKYWLVYDYKKLYKGSCGSHHVQTRYFKRHVESKSLMVSGTEYYKRYGISTHFYMATLTLISFNAKQLDAVYSGTAYTCHALNLTFGDFSKVTPKLAQHMPSLLTPTTS